MARAVVYLQSPSTVLDVGGTDSVSPPGAQNAAKPTAPPGSEGVTKDLSVQTPVKTGTGAEKPGGR